MRFLNFSELDSFTLGQESGPDRFLLHSVRFRDNTHVSFSSSIGDSFINHSLQDLGSSINFH